MRSQWVMIVFACFISTSMIGNGTGKEGQLLKKINLAPPADLRQRDVSFELIALLDRDPKSARNRLESMQEEERNSVRVSAIEILVQSIEDLVKEKISFEPQFELTQEYRREYSLEELVNLMVIFWDEDRRLLNRGDYRGEYFKEADNLQRLIAIHGTKEYLLRLKIFWFLALPEDFAIVYPASGLDYVPGYLFPTLGLALLPFEKVDPTNPSEALNSKMTGTHDNRLNKNLKKNLKFLTNVDPLDVDNMRSLMDQHPLLSEKKRVILMRQGFEEWVKDNWSFLAHRLTRYKADAPPENFITTWVKEMDQKILKEGDFILMSSRVNSSSETAFLRLGYIKLEYPTDTRSRLVWSEPQGAFFLNQIDGFRIGLPRTFSILQKPYHRGRGRRYEIDKISGAQYRIVSMVRPSAEPFESAL